MRLVAIEWKGEQSSVFLWKDDIPSVDFFDGTDCDKNPLAEIVDYCSSPASHSSVVTSESAAFLTQASIAVIVAALLMMLL